LRDVREANRIADSLAILRVVRTRTDLVAAHQNGFRVNVCGMLGTVESLEFRPDGNAGVRLLCPSGAYRFFVVRFGGRRAA
jgi:hypothetical protein